MNQLAPISVARIPQTYANAKSAMVYFLQNSITGAVKIGWSDNLDARLSSLRVGSDCELQLIRTVTGGRGTERWLHKRFCQHLIRGEWFAFHGDMLTVVPPDEVPQRTTIVRRRDVRLTFKEKAAAASTLADGIGLTDKQFLLTLVSDLSDDQARELRGLVAARSDALAA
jgi:hypothetical protein